MKIKSRRVLAIAALLLFSGISLPAGSGARAAAIEHSVSASPSQSPYTSDARLSAQFSPTDFLPDGTIRERYWKRASWVSFDQEAHGGDRFPDSLTQVAFLWSGTYLYVAFRSRYSSLNTYQGEDLSKERWELWKRDVVELFLNPRPELLNRYYEFEVAPNNQWLDLMIDLGQTKGPIHDASWNSGFQHATKVDLKRHLWTCEMRIPFESMQATAPSPREEWRINLFRSEGLGEHRRLLAWSTVPKDKTFHVPARFGILQFLK